MKIEPLWTLPLRDGAIKVCLCPSAITITLEGETDDGNESSTTLHLDPSSVGQIAATLLIAAEAWSSAAREALEAIEAEEGL